MKVIKEGKVPERIRKTIRVECFYCGAELVVNPSDFRIVPGESQILPEYYKYECPCCQRRNALSFDDLSYSFESEIRSSQLHY